LEAHENNWNFWSALENLFGDVVLYHLSTRSQGLILFALWNLFWHEESFWPSVYLIVLQITCIDFDPSISLPVHVRNNLFPLVYDSVMLLNAYWQLLELH
jgi:hypothetical protein